MKTQGSLLCAGLLLIAVGGLVVSAPSAFANKVDCGKVMSEVGAGKKAKEIAKDLNISKSSVYSCKSKAKAAASGAKASPAASPVAAASPASH